MFSRVAAGLILSVSVLTAHVCAQAQEWPRQAPPSPLAPHPFDFPPYEIRTLANGLAVLVVPHHEQPSVSFRLLIRAGAAQEPASRPGVANVVATLLTQGTTSKSASEIATLIDSAGGVIAARSGNELTFVNGAVVKDRTDLALGLASDLVQHPAFAPEEITLQRQQAVSSLQVSYDDPDYIAGLVFDRLVFGKHPYGSPSEGTPESLERISRADLVSFHRTWFVPNNAFLAIVGDLQPSEAFAAAERAFGSWARRDVPAVQSVSPPAPARRLVVIDRPGSAQTELRVGHFSIPRTHPDYITLDLATRILGGEGANRLFGVLRSERGLTYGAAAELRTFRTGGQIVAETDTRTSGTAESLRVMINEFSRMTREDVHPAELLGAQDFIAGNFPLSIEAPAAIAEQVLARLFYGQSLSEIERYPDRVSDVTPADIRRVSRELIKPDALTMVLVGDASAFVNDLRSAGFTTFDRIPLSELDIDSPSLRRTTPVLREPAAR